MPFIQPHYFTFPNGFDHEPTHDIYEADALVRCPGAPIYRELGPTLSRWDPEAEEWLPCTESPSPFISMPGSPTEHDWTHGQILGTLDAVVAALPEDCHTEAMFRAAQPLRQLLIAANNAALGGSGAPVTASAEEMRSAVEDAIELAPELIAEPGKA